MKRFRNFLSVAVVAAVLITSCKPQEVEIKVSSITLDTTTLSLLVNGEYTLTATILPENATNKSVAWTSSNTNVATIENGKVTALAIGNATIIAQAGEKIATCEVSVITEDEVIEVESITLNKTVLSLTEGGNYLLVATVLPTNATNPSVAWTSSNPSVASVENGFVTAIAEGTATIMAQVGDITATCLIIVEDPFSIVEFTEWGIIGESQVVGVTDEGVNIVLLPVILLSREITVDASGHFIWSYGNNFYMYVWMVCTQDEQYIYILGNITADTDFWYAVEEMYIPNTFIPGVIDYDDFFGSYFYKRVYTGNDVDDAELSGVQGALSSGVYELGLSGGGYVIPSYNITVTLLSGEERTFIKNVSAASPIKGLAGTRIKKSDIKIFKNFDDGIVKKSSKIFK